MSDTMDDDGWTSLREAVAQAISEGKALARATADELLAAAAALNATRPSGLLAGGDDLADSPADLVLDAERTLLADLTGELKVLAQRQLDDANTFNIVLFGRTGAGKSSLLEALSHGDGATISPGESDWTTAVNPVDWASCRLVDTPGIEGWGRTMSRAVLEEQAREELVTADVVLLCFDTQNQKAGEFRKVAEWIAEFNKPAIVVLNVRLPNWRFPTRAPRRTVRVRASQTVADHAAHIREGLTAIGLASAPIVATNSQRAVFARAREPFQVPQSEAMLRQRADVGVERLLAWSNLPVLERLLATAVEGGAAQLRRGMLLHQTIGTLERMTQTRLPEVRHEAEVAAAPAEAGIERILELLGAPELHLEGLAVDDAERPRVTAYLARLHELEQARGGRFAAPATGSAQRHGREVVDGLLAPARASARERAETLVDESMADHVVVDRDTFQNRVFDTEEIEQVASTAVRELTSYLERRVGIAAEDVVADLKTVDPRAATIRGTAGRAERVAFIGTSLLMAGVLLAWNPGGWVLIAGGVVASLAAAPLKRWLRRRSARKYENELSRARGEARQAVNDTFERVRDGITDWFMGAARTAMLTHLGGLTDQALVLRQIAATASLNAERIAAAADRVGGWVRTDEDPSAVLREAMRTCERAEGVSGRAHWLGESWCDDPIGLDDSNGPSVHVARHRRGSAMAGLVHSRLATVLAGAARKPSAGSGQYWLAQLRTLLAEDDAAAPLLAELTRMLVDPSPRVLVYGDYNVGKSSLVRRLLVDEGEAVPETLAVRGVPETKCVQAYRWGRFLLVDTPGLQSGMPDHDVAAHESLPDAALVLYVLNANAVTSNRTGLDLVLRGDPDRGVPPKLDRTVFVVNRADELSVDPFDDEEGFAGALARREREIRAALVATPELRRAGVTIPAERILFVASDPLGQVGDVPDPSRADFDEYRYWDGIDAVRATFEEFGPALQSNSVDVSVLDAGLGKLSTLAAAANAESATALAALQQLDRLADDLRDRTHDGNRLLDERQKVLVGLAQGFVGQVIDEALATDDKDTRRTKLEKAESFFGNTELDQLVGEWEVETEQRVEEWIRDTAVVLRRRVESQAFRRALEPGQPIAPVHFPQSSNAAQDVRGVGSTLGRAVQKLAELHGAHVAQVGADQAARVATRGFLEGILIGRQAPMAGMFHQNVALGRAVAIKGETAARVARISHIASRAGTALRIGGGLVEVGTMFYALHTDKRVQAEFARARSRLLEQVSGWADDIHQAAPAVARLRGQLSGLEELAATTGQDRADRVRASDAACDRRDRYDRAIRLGRRTLGIPETDNIESADQEPTT